MNLSIKHIVLVALLLRVAFVLFTHNKIQVQDDAAGYDALAMNLVTHHEFSFEPGLPTARRGPVYPLFLAAIYFVFGHAILAAKIAQSLVSALTLVLVYKIGLRLFDKKTAVTAAVICAVYPFFIYYTGYLLVETLFTFLLAVFVHYTVKSAEEATDLSLFTMGIAGALAILCRSTAYPAVIISILALAWFAKNKVHFLRSILLIALPIALLISLWGIRNYRHFGSFTIAHSGAAANMFGSLYSYQQRSNGIPMDSLAGDEKWEKGIGPVNYNDRYYFREFKKIFLEQPSLFFRNSFIKFCRLWRVYPMIANIKVSFSPTESIIWLGFFVYDLVLLFALFGLYDLRKNLGKYVFILIPVFAFSLVHMVFSSQPRFRRPIMPYVILFAASGMVAAYTKACNTSSKPDIL